MKIFISLLALLLWGMAPAQIPNGGFENWHPVGNGQGEDPDHWESNNRIVDTPGIEKSTDAHSGNYALRINATSILEQFRVIYLGNIEFDTTNRQGSFPGLVDASCAGAPIQNVPRVLTGYYKLVAPPVNKGVADINVSITSQCLSLPLSHVPFLGNFNNFQVSKDSTSSYRFFAVALQEDIPVTDPLDTLRINAGFYVDTNRGQVGKGYLLLDDLQLLGTLGQEEYAAEVSFSVFPNPAGEALHLEVEEAFEARTVEVYDLKGSFVLQTPFRSTLDVSALPPAMYLVKVIGKRGELLETFVMR